VKLTTTERQKLEASNCLAWVLLNDGLTETGDKIEIKDRLYLRKVFEDNSPLQAIKKSAQVAFSTTYIFKAFHLARFGGANIGYTLPTKTIVNDFVKPKVNPIILQNPFVQQEVTEDSLTIKKVGNRFVYFRGSFEERMAISISLDCLLMDEFDRSDQTVLEVMKSRLKASKMGWIWRFSNPSIPQGGVDYYWKLSDRKEWFNKCERCNHWAFPTFTQRERYKTHFVDIEKEKLVCGKCGKPLRREDRRVGEWVAEFPKKDISGYHLSHLMCPWISIKDIIIESQSSPQYFHNFILGEPYVTKDLAITREAIIKCLAPSKPKDVAQWYLGVDTKAGPKHWTLGCIAKNGEKWVRGYGMTESWDDIIRIRNEHNAMTVIDANPYPQYPRKLTKEFPGRVFMHWFKEDTKDVGIIRWGRSSPTMAEEFHKVFSDRTKLIDEFVYSLNNQEILFSLSLGEIEDYIQHLTIMYRALIAQPAQPGHQPKEKPMWVTPTGKPDDWAFSTFYMFVAMHRYIGSKGKPVGATIGRKEWEKPWHVQKTGLMTRPTYDIKEKVKIRKQRLKKSWKYR
jgi:hypothetical protein